MEGLAAQAVPLLLFGACIAGLAGSVAFAPRRWVWAAALGWALAPAAVYWVVVAFSAAAGAASATWHNAVYGFVLIGSIAAGPWLVLCAIGIGIGLALRRRRTRDETPADRAERAPGPVLPRRASIPRGSGGTAGRFGAWRQALLILIGAAAAIAGLTYLSLSQGPPPAQPLTPLPTFRP